jgi:hypothetical protein
MINIGDMVRVIGQAPGTNAIHTEHINLIGVVRAIDPSDQYPVTVDFADCSKSSDTFLEEELEVMFTI